MSVRGAVTAMFLALAASACTTPGGAEAPRTEPAAAAPGDRKEACEKDADCKPPFECTGEHRCTCDFDQDCAATQRCLAGVCRAR